MSSLAWIDFDEAERQRAQRLMALFQERETRDELGLGGSGTPLLTTCFRGPAPFRHAYATCFSSLGYFRCWKSRLPERSAPSHQDS